MGLSVSVYQNIKKTDNEEEYDFEAYVIDEKWEHKIKNLEKGCIYSGDRVDHSISYPYSAHNRFRETLIKLTGRSKLLKVDGTIDFENLPTDIPFYDFIDFADNEGCLDWEISEKIYNDFKEWEERAMIFYDDFSIVRYLEWLNVFDKAKNGGVVVFG